MTEIEFALKKMMGRGNSPSVQYFLFDENHIIKKMRLDLQTFLENRKVDRKTTYHAFSVTKTFTALAILQLAEEKRIDIEQPAKNYLPSFPYPANITIRQLLSDSADIRTLYRLAGYIWQQNINDLTALNSLKKSFLKTTRPNPSQIKNLPIPIWDTFYLASLSRA